VADLAVAVARRLGWAEPRLARLRLAALLHDVGKVALPDGLLRREGPLDEEELAVVRSHAALGAELVAGVEGLEALVPWIRHVHERVDGSGYPRGLAGQEIPLESRIIAVADAWDAMTSDRPHRPALAREAALAELRAGCGSRFDARCADLLLEELGAPCGAGVDAGAVVA
jgi:HD-GYP domain-containing protein (c-di-GMP phosphodiesterase class II)